jgi:hypothetical protein
VFYLFTNNVVLYYFICLLILGVKNGQKTYKLASFIMSRASLHGVVKCEWDWQSAYNQLGQFDKALFFYIILTVFTLWHMLFWCLYYAQSFLIVNCEWDWQSAYNQLGQFDKAFFLHYTYCIYTLTSVILVSILCPEFSYSELRMGLSECLQSTRSVWQSTFFLHYTYCSYTLTYVILVSILCPEFSYSELQKCIFFCDCIKNNSENVNKN